MRPVSLRTGGFLYERVLVFHIHKAKPLPVRANVAVSGKSPRL